MNQSLTGDCVSNNVTERKVRLCSSLKEIDTLLNDTFRYDRVNDLLNWICCVSNFSPPLAQNKFGVFSVSNVKYEKLEVRSSRFKNLTAHLIAHVNSPSHRKNSDKREEYHLKEMAAKSARNVEIGNKIGSPAYFFFYNKLPFLLFERFLPWVSLHKIDIGQENHSQISPPPPPPTTL